MLAYVTIERATCAPAYSVRVHASFHPSWVVGSEYSTLEPMTLRQAREFCKANGLETRLPTIGLIEATTRDKCPHFFSRGARRSLDRSHGAHRLTVQRGADGSIQVTNGRTSWVWTGDNLRTII